MSQATTTKKVKINKEQHEELSFFIQIYSPYGS